MHRFWKNKSVVSFLFLKILDEKLHQRASAVAFSFTIAIFPAILFLFTLIPYIPIPNLHNEILDFIIPFFPQGTFKFVEETILNIIAQKQSGKLIFGLGMSLYSSTSGMRSLLMAINKSYGIKNRRGFLKIQLVSLLSNIFISGLLIFSVLFILIVRSMLNYFEDSIFIDKSSLIFGIQAFQLLLVFGIFFLLVCSLYHIAPQVSPYHYFNRGALFASLGSVIITHFFSYYITEVASFNKVYGSIGALIALMLWVYLMCFMILLGAEINKVYTQEKNVYNSLFFLKS